ncbi:hypothetical protein [Cellulomonas sp. Y8]|uniref:hypothetical protein n=1 Tax=Cellulomonas sp. Y8 TaxID=2591145 RepID=UPI003D723E39
MSPKKRRKPDRGRTSTRGGAHAVTPLAVALREAPRLTGTDRLIVKLVASSWLGLAWSTRDTVATDAEGDLVREIARAQRSRPDRAGAALAALAAIAVPPWGDEARAALPAAASADSDGPPRPVSARRWSDAWDSERLYVLAYAEPVPHSVVVKAVMLDGVVVEELVVEVPGESTPPPEDSARDDIDAVLAEVADALRQTDELWPARDDGEYSEARAFARWLVQGAPRLVEPRPSLSAAERAWMVDELVARRWPWSRLDEPTVRQFARIFIRYGERLLFAGPLAWSPTAAVHFLLDWFPAEVSVDPEVGSEVPALLSVWVQIALERRGLTQEHIDEVVEAVVSVEDEFTESLPDPEWDAFREEITRRVEAEGSTLRNGAAVHRAVLAHYAEADPPPPSEG